MELDINELKRLADQQEFPLGVSTGKMGICLCLYVLGRKLNNEAYESYATDILHNVLADTQKIASIDMKHGLIGVGITLNYLVDKGYVDGDINYILHDADNLVLKNLNPQNDVDFELDTLIDMLYYIVIRLGNKSIKKDYKYLFQETAINYINKLSDRIDNVFFEESIPFSIENKPARLLYLLSLFYKLDFYNSRLNTILYEMSYKLLSFLPMLNSNKLLLLSAMSSVKEYCKIENWQKHIDLLKNELDVDMIIRQEIREKNFSVCNGLAGMLLVLELSKQEFSSEEYDKIKSKLLTHSHLDILKEKVLNPKSTEVSLLYGELGALTIYNMIEA